MNRLLGVSAEVSLEEGLRRTIEWFKRGGEGP
jgi:nucleoside-diphosphate-sugar epimerase